MDTFSGRVLEGRRYSDGLHQCIEAKEGEYNSTLARNINEKYTTSVGCKTTCSNVKQL